MTHTEDAAHTNKTRAVDVVRMPKTVAYLPPGGGRRSLWVLGELLTYKVSSQQTGGAYSLFEVTTQPGAGPPPHVHHREDESFYVLEGEFEFLSGEDTPLRVGAGSLLYVPKGTLHSHENVGEGVGRILLTQTPGGLYEYFFEEVGKPVDGDAGPLAFEDHPDARRIVALAAQYGIEIPPPIAEESSGTFFPAKSGH
jgi:mannose-6-phosphate isomerase-like protein (cupin superfamily)